MKKKVFLIDIAKTLGITTKKARLTLKEKGVLPEKTSTWVGFEPYEVPYIVAQLFPENYLEEVRKKVDIPF